jgi:hypothetical protein
MRQALRTVVALAALALTLAPFAAASEIPGEVYRATVWTQGQGSVKSMPNGIACPGSCVGIFRPHARVTFKPKPAKGWAFDRWYAGCKGTKPVCALEVKDGGITVGARFRKL